MKTYVFSTFTVLLLMMCSSLAWGQRNMQQRSKVNKPTNPVLYEQKPAATTPALEEPTSVNYAPASKVLKIDNSGFINTGVAQEPVKTPAYVQISYNGVVIADSNGDCGVQILPRYGKPLTEEEILYNASYKIGPGVPKIRDTSCKIFTKGETYNIYVAEGRTWKIIYYDENGLADIIKFETKIGENPNHTYTADGRTIRESW
jgi:hypothetical protein